MMLRWVSCACNAFSGSRVDRLTESGTYFDLTGGVRKIVLGNGLPESTQRRAKRPLFRNARGFLRCRSVTEPAPSPRPWASAPARPFADDNNLTWPLPAARLNR